MVAVPAFAPVARPLGNIVATPAAPTGTRSGAVQVEAAVLSMVDPSLNVSSAVYCRVLVIGIEVVAGVTVNDTDVAAFTVKVAEPDLPP
jgi:hypothetical protein